jgi:MarR family transcriptional regulator, transcriptional regulator for hemolysin
VAAKRNDLTRNPGYLLQDVARLLRVAFDRRVRHLGLTRAQWFVLAHLYRDDGRTQRALADELDMEPAPLGRLIDRLEESGWVRRAPAPGDRRAKLVFLTEKILPLVEELRTAAERLYADAFEGLPAKRFEDLVDALALAKSNLLELAAESVEFAADGTLDPLRRVQRKAARQGQ